MTVKVNQTDFDKMHGSKEGIPWIKADGAFVSRNCSGPTDQNVSNPCKAQNKCEGDCKRPAPFTCVNAKDVTANVSDGRVEVSAQLGAMTDECASQGFLLDGWVEICCTGASDGADAANSTGTTKSTTSTDAAKGTDASAAKGTDAAAAKGTTAAA